MLLSSSNRKFPPFPLLSYFPWLCAWYVSYIIFCHLLHIRSGKTGNLSSLLLCSLWWVQIFGYVLACSSHSFACTVHHLITSLCKFIWRHWSYKMLVRYILIECVIKIKHILSVIHYTVCGAVCFQFTHFSCDDWDTIYNLSYYHHQIGSMNYLPIVLGLGHETMVSAVCLSIFFWTRQWTQRSVIRSRCVDELEQSLLIITWYKPLRNLHM